MENFEFSVNEINDREPEVGFDSACVDREKKGEVY